MKPSTWMRVASGLMAFFAVGHTVGHFRGPSRGVQNDFVVAAMKSAHFDVMGSSRTYWDFYQGFSMYVIVTPVLLAVLLWLLGDLARTQPRQARPMVWVLAVGIAIFAIIAWTNFFLAPAMINTLAAACLVIAALAA